jgi:hypothetical protein
MGQEFKGPLYPNSNKVKKYQLTTTSGSALCAGQAQATSGTSQ